MKKVFFLIGFLFTINMVFAKQQDSIKTIKENGATFVVHKVEKGETFYSICRLYGAKPSETIQYNPSALEVIKTGDVLKIPLPEVVEKVVQEETKIHVIKDQQYAYTKHIVVKGETLYSISRRFKVPVSDIKTFNNLTSDRVNIGQELIVKREIVVQIIEEDSISVDIDKNELIESENVVRIKDGTPDGIGDMELIEVNEFDNKKEGDEITQSGFVKLITDMDIDQNRNYVYHAKAKVGTIVLVTNPQNNKSIFARVLGPFNVAEEENQGFLMLVTSNVVESIGIKDKESMLVQINFTK